MKYKGLISVNYEIISGWHIFTSKDIYGLHVYARDILLAFMSIPEHIIIVMKNNYGLNVIVTPLKNRIYEVKVIN